ncbi:HAMP domain-containing sensor histidine kinase [Flavobacterium sp. SUN052]|uniref:sensor histidine kinase n=1 Tax=Flavobacterium sp. SUN052 TaxID=3002441 RepID=UPI00237EE41C|nr:HAMP domain-containing sensor histidine kinase [Flavobacterium sp. SUN052]MEC4003338.1 HAMP domain-containing sensor histidine kinase [Flavobacterium sp. SUN052]
MTLKRKIAVNVSIAFSILFGLASIFIYLRFSSFRKEEFKQRLEEKALTTTKLLLDVKKVDKKLIKLIDENSINNFYNEKTLVFNDDFTLIYSSVGDAEIKWTPNDLKRLSTVKSFFKSDNERDLVGINFTFEQGNYYVLITAEDKYGYSKMEYLMYSLIITFFVSILLVWVFTYLFIKKQLSPLDTFEKKITSISANQLNEHLAENENNDEINLLTKAFNQMLDRLENAFATQKEFTSNASHELYTPLTRISFQLENLINTQKHSETTLEYLKSINNDVHQIADLINSLLLLAKVNKEEMGKKFKKIRIDEVIFDTYEQVKKINTNFNLDFDIQIADEIENPMEVLGSKSLLKIAFTNLLKNAYLYSSNNKASVVINQTEQQQIIVLIQNQGKTITNTELNKIFEPFTRGENSIHIQGSGLGLPIVKRILDYHNATITYNSPNENTNEFKVTFSI